MAELPKDIDLIDRFGSKFDKDYFKDRAKNRATTIKQILIGSVGGVALLGLLIAGDVRKNNLEALRDPARLSETTISKVRDLTGKQIKEIESIFGYDFARTMEMELARTAMSVSGPVEPREIIIELFKAKGKIAPALMTPTMIRFYERLNSMSPAEVETAMKKLQKMKSFEDSFTKPELKRDWQEFKKVKEERVKEFRSFLERSKNTRVMEHRTVVKAETFKKKSNEAELARKKQLTPRRRA